MSASQGNISYEASQVFYLDFGIFDLALLKVLYRMLFFKLLYCFRYKYTQVLNLKKKKCILPYDFISHFPAHCHWFFWTPSLNITFMKTIWIWECLACLLRVRAGVTTMCELLANIRHPDFYCSDWPAPKTIPGSRDFESEFQTWHWRGSWQ